MAPTETDRRGAHDMAAWLPDAWDTDGDGALDDAEVAAQVGAVGVDSGMHSAMGWVGRTFTPSSSYVRARERACAAPVPTRTPPPCMHRQ
jgi:hypothetical protein